MDQQGQDREDGDPDHQIQLRSHNRRQQQIHGADHAWHQHAQQHIHKYGHIALQGLVFVGPVQFRFLKVQHQPEGCGQYDGKSEYWLFIEGLADAVRVACGCFDQDFSSKDRTRGDSWRKGYRVTGYFIYWLQLNKDKDFIRKFNRSAVELKPWSWDKAMKHILGDKPENTTDALWQEYMKAVGD